MRLSGEGIMDRDHIVIAIDGPAASGKSSVARRVARDLDFIYVNTGAMYRAVTWLAMKRATDPDDPIAVTALAKNNPIEFGLSDGEATIRIAGLDPSDELSSPEINLNVSAVARNQEVRALLVARQREYLASGDLVMEGRDIGTAVFPETPYKFYIDASPEIRARRRAAQGQEDEITARDRIDATRKHSPLMIASDAAVIDTTEMPIGEVVQTVLGILAEKGVR
jgi:cytidylate kinase